MNYLANRLKEASTWRGLVIIATALGAKMTPEQADAIINTGLLIAGFIGAVSKG